MNVVLLNLLARYDIALDTSHKVISAAHITLTPETGIKLFFKKRAHPAYGF